MKNVFHRSKLRVLDLERTPRRGFVVKRISFDPVAFGRFNDIVEVVGNDRVSHELNNSICRKSLKSIFHQPPQRKLFRFLFSFVNHASLSSLDWSSMMLKANGCSISYMACSFLPHHQNSIVSQYLLLSVVEIFSTGLYYLLFERIEKL